MDTIAVMEEVYSLKEAAELLKMPSGSVRLRRGDTAELTPIQFADTPNAPIFYLREEVLAILRARAERIQFVRQKRNRGGNHYARS
jgi:hypothetical protein